MMTSIKKQLLLKEATKITRQLEMSDDLYDEEGFCESKLGDLSKASVKAVRKRQELN
jgi:hypothetical protein